MSTGSIQNQIDTTLPPTYPLKALVIYFDTRYTERKLAKEIQMEPKLSKTLYHQDTAVTALVDKTEAAAQEAGRTLSRWQTNSKQHGHVEMTTYSIHVGARASQFRYQDDPIVYCYLTQLEGKTSRCEAYRELDKMLREFCEYMDWVAQRQATI